ncbi:MAG: hypothetical protein J5855_06930 [Mailhella sp.]|nr:hypothetical protein [Mailhella sp.]
MEGTFPFPAANRLSTECAAGRYAWPIRRQICRDGVRSASSKTTELTAAKTGFENAGTPRLPLTA